MTATIEPSGVARSFSLNNQGGAVIRVAEGATRSVAAGDCVTLTGSSGVGKATVMRMIHGNDLAAAGLIPVGGVDVAKAEPRAILTFRRETPGHVSQFARVVPRVPTREVLAAPLLAVGTNRDEALKRAEELLRRGNIPAPLWSLLPTTSSGGEQRHVNIARGFVHASPAMLLDEPTAALDATNRDTAPELTDEAKTRGATIVGIDPQAHARVAMRAVDLFAFAPERAA